MIEVTARQSITEWQKDALMLPKEVEVGVVEETRYIPTSENVRLRPSTHDGWGTAVTFPDGTTWTVKRAPSELAGMMGGGDDAEGRVRTALYDVMTLLKEHAERGSDYLRVYDKASDICHDNDLNPITAKDQ